MGVTGGDVLGYFILFYLFLSWNWPEVVDGGPNLLARDVDLFIFILLTF